MSLSTNAEKLQLWFDRYKITAVQYNTWLNAHPKCTKKGAFGLALTELIDTCGSIRCDLDKYMIVAPNTEFNLGTNDFTIEWFQYQLEGSYNPRVFQFGEWPSELGVSIEPAGGGFTFYFWYDQEKKKTKEINSPLNKWTHFAISRVSGITGIYVDGVRFIEFSDVYDINVTDIPMHIGVDPGWLDSTYFNGIITNFRFINGTGLYSDTTLIVPTTVLEVVENTKFLLIARDADTYLKDLTGYQIVENHGAGFNNGNPFSNTFYDLILSPIIDIYPEKETEILWNCFSLTGSALLSYTIDRINWIDIAVVNITDNSYLWISPSTPQAICLFKIASIENPLMTSQVPFSIIGEANILMTSTGIGDVNMNLVYPLQGKNVTVSWGDGIVDIVSCESKHKGEWAYLPSHSFIQQIGPPNYGTLSVPNNPMYYFINGTPLVEIIFPKLSLTYLHISETQLESIDLSELTNLTTLELNQNLTLLSTNINSPLLTYMSFSENNISDLSLSNIIAPSLVEFHMSSEPMTTIPENWFDNLLELKVLGITKGQLDTAPTISLNKLETLALSGNKLDVIYADTFSNLPALKQLELSDNLIASIDSNAFYGTNLVQLYLGRNRLTSELEPSSFAGLPNLEVFEILGNGIDKNVLTGLSPNVFDELPLGCSIYISGCQLTVGDIDNLLISFSNAGRHDAYFDFSGNNGRTSASDSAVANLIENNCGVYI